MRVRVVLAAALAVALTSTVPVSAQPTSVPMLQKKPGVGVPAVLGPEDCISYNPAGLSIGARAPYWELIAAPMVLHVFQTRRDAMIALAVARMHTKQCFVGRGNTMGAQRESYIMEYWK